MTEEKEYHIGDELVGLFDDSTAFLQLRDSALKLPFGYKKAKRAAIDHVQAKRKFWESLRKLYPELDGEYLIYNSEKKTVRINTNPKDIE